MRISPFSTVATKQSCAFWGAVTVTLNVSEGINTTSLEPLTDSTLNVSTSLVSVVSGPKSFVVSILHELNSANEAMSISASCFMMIGGLEVKPFVVDGLHTRIDAVGHPVVECDDCCQRHHVEHYGPRCGDDAHAVDAIGRQGVEERLGTP